MDGVIAVDTIALNDIVGAYGERLPLPDGGSIGGAELSHFATQAIDMKYPRADQDAERSTY